MTDEAMRERAIEDEPRWRRIAGFPLVALLIAVVLYAAAAASAVLIMKVTPVALPGFTKEMSFDVLAGLLLLIVYKLAIRHLGEKPRDELRIEGAFRPLAWGILAGLVVFSLIVGAAALLGIYRITGEGDSTGLLPALITSAIFPAISEEMMFRGILFRWIEEFGGSWAALLLTSVLFGAAHLSNPNSSYVAAVGIALEAGVMLGAAYMLTRSLWLPMGLHAAWNFAQGEVWDIPVSGTDVHGLVVARLQGPPLLTGAGFGLEASVIAMVVATAFGLWLLRLAIGKGEVVAPWWVRRRRIGSEKAVRVDVDADPDLGAPV